MVREEVGEVMRSRRCCLMRVGLSVVVSWALGMGGDHHKVAAIFRRGMQGW